MRVFCTQGGSRTHKGTVSKTSSCANLHYPLGQIVVIVGLEPTHLSILDFESSVSTNSNHITICTQGGTRTRKGTVFKTSSCAIYIIHLGKFVTQVRLELTRSFNHQFLKLTCIPIPSLSQFCTSGGTRTHNPFGICS